jgi:alpha-beta hydrolase superfamily lysophospholipase
VGIFADLVNTPRLARESFCEATPEAIFESCAARVESGSKRAGSGGMVVRVEPTRVTTPLLVLDGGKDAALTPGEVRATARAFGVRAEYFPNMGHHMMLEPNWREVAERIHQWLVGNGL